MTSEAADITHVLAVEISADQLEAYVRPVGQAAPEIVNHEALAQLVKDAGIVVNDEVSERMQKFLTLIHEHGIPEDPFLIARGTKPVEGKDAEFVWGGTFQEAALDWQDDGPIDFYKSNALLTVDKDDVLGTITPAQEGKAGTDVCGNVLKPKIVPRDIDLDATVARSPADPTQIVALVPGRAVFKQRRLGIHEALDIQGDVDFETGSIDSTVDVNIRGTVRDHFEVKSTKSVVVGGAIEAAMVQAHEVVVRGGILNRNEGRVRATQNITAKFCSEANLHSDGSIHIAKASMESQLYAEDRVEVPHGSVIGGVVCARRGATIQVAGSDAGIVTTLCVGISPQERNQIQGLNQELEEKRRALQRIQNVLQALLVRQATLNPDQQERLTAMKRQADVLDAEMREMAGRRDRLGQGDAALVVSKIIHEGVVVRIGNQQTFFRRQMKGPVRIEKRDVDGYPEIVAVNQLTGSVSVLPSQHAEDDVMDAEQLAGTEEGDAFDGHSR